jgi:hypothetical protein
MGEVSRTMFFIRWICYAFDMIPETDPQYFFGLVTGTVISWVTGTVLPGFLLNWIRMLFYILVAISRKYFVARYSQRPFFIFVWKSY